MRLVSFSSYFHTIPFHLRSIPRPIRHSVFSPRVGGKKPFKPRCLFLWFLHGECIGPLIYVSRCFRSFLAGRPGPGVGSWILQGYVLGPLWEGVLVSVGKLCAPFWRSRMEVDVGGTSAEPSARNFRSFVLRGLLASSQHPCLSRSRAPKTCAHDMAKWNEASSQMVRMYVLTVSCVYGR